MASRIAKIGFRRWVNKLWFLKISSLRCTVCESVRSDTLKPTNAVRVIGSWLIFRTYYIGGEATPPVFVSPANIVVIATRNRVARKKWSRWRVCGTVWKLINSWKCFTYTRRPYPFNYSAVASNEFTLIGKSVESSKPVDFWIAQALHTALHAYIYIYNIYFTTVIQSVEINRV